MKKLFAPVLALILILALYAPALAEGTAQTGLAAYGYCDDVESLLETADQALADGMDPKAVGEEMYALAEANGLTDAFNWYIENIAACDTDEYRRFQNSFPHFDQMLPDHISDRTSDILVYSTTEVSDAMKALLADPGAQFCHEPVYWSESDFADFYGVSYAKFKPSRPRAGYVCVIVEDSAQSAPASWKRMRKAIFITRLPSMSTSCFGSWKMTPRSSPATRTWPPPFWSSICNTPSAAITAASSHMSRAITARFR